MNRRAGGNQNGRGQSQAQSSGQSQPQSNGRVESSGVFEVRALAASARPASPAPRARASELSGIVGRRDSVVGMRVLETPARAPNRVSMQWLALGFAVVMAPGLAGVWYLGHMGSAPQP